MGVKAFKSLSAWLFVQQLHQNGKKEINHGSHYYLETRPVTRGILSQRINDAESVFK